MHVHDWLEEFRAYVYPKIHAAVSGFGLYAEVVESPSGYACSFEATQDRVENILHHEGFVRNAFAAFKTRAKSGDASVGSWAWYPDGIFGEYQLHVTLYSAFDDGYVDVYAHWEPNAIRHPVRHYRGQEVDVAKGVTKVRTMLGDRETERRPPEDRYLADR